METYSLQRGEEYETKVESMSREYNTLKIRREEQHILHPDEQKRLEELSRLLGITQYLIDNEGNFHFSSIKTNTFGYTNPETEKLRQILRTNIQEVPKLLCAPEYRDAIIFYDVSGRILSTLNVCLSCMYIETKIFNHINTDYETYDLLKKWFINIGHEVENPTYFITDDINKLENKYSESKSG